MVRIFSTAFLNIAEMRVVTSTSPTAPPTSIGSEIVKPGVSSASVSAGDASSCPWSSTATSSAGRGFQATTRPQSGTSSTPLPEWSAIDKSLGADVESARPRAGVGSINRNRAGIYSSPCLENGKRDKEVRLVCQLIRLPHAAYSTPRKNRVGFLHCQVCRRGSAANGVNARGRT